MNNITQLVGPRGMTTAELIEFHRSQFGDARMEAESEGEPGGVAPQRGPGSDGSKPVADMTPDEKADYFSRKADRLAGILKGYGDITPEQLAELRDKASRHDELEHELMSDKDKAVADAKKAAESETRAAFLPRLAAAELRAAAAAKGVTAEKLEAALEFVDKALFLKGDAVDSDKVGKFVEGLAPATPKGPSSFGLGARAQSALAPGDQGRAQAAKRFGAKS